MLASRLIPSIERHSLPLNTRVQRCQIVRFSNVFFFRVLRFLALWLLLALTSVSPLSTAWAQAPAAAPTLSAIPGNSQVSLNWEAIAGATSYRVYQSTSEGDLGTNVTTPGTTHASITGLTNGTIYYFTVAARNASGDGPNSAQVAVTPILFPVLSPAVLGDNSVTLNWTSVPGASYYEVYRALVSASFGTTPLTTTTATTFTDSTAVNTTAYQYRVRAANPTPNTYLTSVTRTATPMAAPVVSVVPGNLQVSLTWNEIAGSYPVPGSGAYHVYRSTVAGELGTLASARNTPDSSVTSLTNGTTYYFSVQARNVTGGGPFSAQVSCTPIPAPVLNAPILGDNLISLEWSSVIGASYYEVYRALVGDSFGTTPYATTTATTWADTSVSNGTAYQYKIRAANPDPNVNLTSAVKNATPMAAPVLSAVPGYRQVSLSWEAMTGATSYRVYQSTVAGELGTVVVSPTVTNASRTGLAVGTTYYYTVQARNATGSGPLSQQISVLSVQPAVVSIAGIGDGSVSLVWTAVTGATQYEIYRGPDTASFGTTPLSTTTSLSYTDTTATNGTAFYYKVRAANPDPNPNLDSNVVTAKSMAAPVVTAVPGVAQVALSWSAASGATGYRVYQSSVNGELGTLMQTTAGLTSSRTSLTNGTTYYFTVIPYNSTNSGPASVQVSAKPLALPVAVNPVTLTPGDAQIGLSFASVANASEYRIYRATTSNGYDYGTPTLTATGTGTVTALDTGLANGTTYYYVVRSVNTSGVSASSTQVSATTLARPVAAVLNATAGDGEVALNWNTVSAATSYTLRRSTAAGGPYGLVASGLTATSYTDGTVNNGTTHYYVVTASNASGEGAASNEAMARPVPTLTLPPSNLSAQVGDLEILLTWDAVDEAAGYKIVRSTNPGDFTGSPVITVTEPSYLDTNVEHGTTYYYQVRAFNAVGQSPPAEISVTAYARQRFDARIAPATGNGWQGSGIVNDTGDLQSVESKPTANQTVVYRVAVSRSGGTGNSQYVAVTLPNWSALAAGDWTARFYNSWTGGTDITNLITSAQGWQVLSSNSQELNVRVELTAPANAVVGNSQSLLVRVTEAEATGSEILASDTVKAIATVRASTQPDLAVRPLTNADEGVADWTGADIIGGTTQILSVVTVAGTPRKYELRIKNAGNSAKSFTLRLPSVPTGWTDKLFDSLTGTTEITAAAHEESGWATPELAPGDTLSLRLEVIGTLAATANYESAIEVASEAETDQVTLRQLQQKVVGLQWSDDNTLWHDVTTSTLIEAHQLDVIGLRALKAIPTADWPDSNAAGPDWSFHGQSYVGESVWLHADDLTDSAGELATVTLGSSASVRIKVTLGEGIIRYDTLD